MKKDLLQQAFVFYIACLITVGSSPTAWSQSQVMTTEDITRRSDLVAVGRVRDLHSEWTAERRCIVTRVTVSVNEYLKGNYGQAVTVLVPGGEVDGVGEWYSHTPRFKKDEDVVLFARKQGPAEFHVTGGEGGKVTISQDPGTGVSMIAGGVTLDEFKKRIKATPSK